MGVQFISLAVDGGWEVRPEIFRDHRGTFLTTYDEEAFAHQGLNTRWIAENQSFNHQPGTLRGFHFQAPPYAQTKLVRVASGRAWDVIVDLRPTSPTYLKWAAVELRGEWGNSIYVPAGFAHAYITLEPATTVIYLVDAPYHPASEGGLRWNDKTLDIPWPWEGEPILSLKDQNLPTLLELKNPFS